MCRTPSTHTRIRLIPDFFVVGSQIASLTPGLSFDHNLCCKYPNGSCEAIFDIYTSRPFQRYKEHFKARCFNLYNRTLKLQESQRTPSSHFWECESHPHTCFKVGLRHFASNLTFFHHVKKNLSVICATKLTNNFKVNTLGCNLCKIS